MMRLLLCIVFMTAFSCFSQTDTLPEQMARYASCKNTDQLFVHTDKHIYTNNESVWFSAWLLRLGLDSLPMHRFLSVVMVPADTRLPAVQQKFAMAGGYSYGSLQLPDSIAPGEYKLLAYTNVLDSDSMPLAIFTQEITVKYLRESAITAAATILEDAAGKKDLLVTVRNKTNYQPIRDAAVTLWCGDSKMIKVKTDKNGTWRQDIAALKPATATVTPVIYTRVKFEGDVEYVQTKWPGAVMPRQLDIRCYPEGGYLVANNPTRIAWEATTSNGEPLAIKAIVLEGQQALDTIKTDERGLGTIMLTPKSGAVYSIQPVTYPNELQLQKDGYHFPNVLSKGASMHMPKAVANDSLWLRVHGTGYSQVTMVVHNFRTVFNQQTLSIKDGGVKVLLLLHKIPKGLAAVTLLDDENRPLAERIFFAHYDNKAVCTITPDKTVYEKRQKVTLTFQLNNNQLAASGFASVSCAQANRFTNSKQQDIESFAFLNSELQEITDNNGLIFRKTDQLEKILLVRGWRRFTWQEMLAGNHSVAQYVSPAISGYVVAGSGKIKKPVPVNLFGGEAGIAVMSTDAKGHFQFNSDHLLVAQEKKLSLLAGDKMDRNTIVIQDPWLAINKRVAAAIPFQQMDAARYLQFAQDMTLDELKKVKQLAVVTVTTKRNTNTSLWGSRNACGDFVCRFNKLNCYGHIGEPDNKAPEKGKVYRMNGGGEAVYWGCAIDENNPQYEGIKTGKEFYVDDHSEVSLTPKYISTIYWAPMLLFNKEGKATASFFTSDITGRYRIVVNGVTGDNMFYATGSIGIQ